MEKLKLGKHNHSLTDILKVIIFSIVMLAPFFSILFRCLYVATNKNAKDSYSGESTYQINYKYQSNEVNSASDLVVGNIYAFNYSDNDLQAINQQAYFDIVILSQIEFEGNIDEAYYLANDGDNYKANEILITISDTSLYINYMNNNTEGETFYMSYNNVYFTKNFIGKLTYLDLSNGTINTSLISQTDYNEIESVDINNNGTLDNAFEYSIKQLSESTTFNWVQNTALYTPINNMTIGLGFDNEHNTLALLLTYWTLNTAIYIIFDIVIGIFTKLTHIVQN